jgi:hypothetical protein
LSNLRRRRGPPAIDSYLSYKEINGGVASTIEEFHDRLRRYPMQNLVGICSVFNTRLTKWTGEYNWDFHTQMVRESFPPSLANDILATRRLAFHRHQLLFVIQEALRLSPIVDRPIDETDLAALGTMLLMASDHLDSPIPERVDTPEAAIQLVSSVIPTIEANGLNSYLMKMARSHLMLTRFIEPLRKESNFFDVDVLFKKATGIPLEVHEALLVGLLSRFGNLNRIQTSDNPEDFAIPGTWFQSTSVPVEQVELFLREVAASPEDLATRVRHKNPALNDFTVLKDKPLFRAKDQWLPIDMAFLAEKSASGAFWRIHNDALKTKSEREDFHSFWGRVFEAYLNWLLQKSCEGRANRPFPDPRYQKNQHEQVCDNIVLSGRAAVLIESKGSTFSATGKYGEDAGIFKREIEEKLVGSKNRPKGVMQLVRAVESLCAFEDSRAITGLDLSDVTTLYPLIITRDDLGSTFGLNAYLNQRFQDPRSVSPPWRTITPLFCLSADDVEAISPYLSDTPLFEILQSKYHADKGLMAPMSMTSNKILEQKGHRAPTILLDAIKEAARLGNEFLRVKPTRTANADATQRT